MQPLPGNGLDLGLLPGRNASLTFPRTERDKHLYVCGGTGTGKSKFLDHLIRQDIRNWHKSRCGLILLDPHGNLYDSLMEWLAWNDKVLNVPVVPIDLRRDDWIVSYNVLRQREFADPAVLVDNITDAMAYVWGQGGTNQTPLFARWAGNVLRALYEKNLTLVEAEHLVDRVAKQMRYAMTSDLKDKPSRDVAIRRYAERQRFRIADRQYGESSSALHSQPNNALDVWPAHRVPRLGPCARRGFDHSGELGD